MSNEGFNGEVNLMSFLQKIGVDSQTLLYWEKVQPQELLETINTINDAIQSTMECSNKEIPFLDTLIKRDSSGIWMDLYHKPTETQSRVVFCIL